MPGDLAWWKQPLTCMASTHCQEAPRARGEVRVQCDATKCLCRSSVDQTGFVEGPAQQSMTVSDGCPGGTHGAWTQPRCRWARSRRTKLDTGTAQCDDTNTKIIKLHPTRQFSIGVCCCLSSFALCCCFAASAKACTGRLPGILGPAARHYSHATCRDQSIRPTDANPQLHSHTQVKRTMYTAQGLSPSSMCLHACCRWTPHKRWHTQPTYKAQPEQFARGS